MLIGMERWIADETLSQVFDLSSQLKQKLRNKNFIINLFCSSVYSTTLRLPSKVDFKKLTIDNSCDNYQLFCFILVKFCV